MPNAWPSLDYLECRDTCSVLNLYLQIAGKYRWRHAVPAAGPKSHRIAIGTGLTPPD